MVLPVSISIPGGANRRGSGDAVPGVSYCDGYSGLACHQGAPAADVGENESGSRCHRYEGVPAGGIPVDHIPGLPAVTNAGDLAYWDSLDSGLLYVVVGIGGGLHGSAFARGALSTAEGCRKHSVS